MGAERSKRLRCAVYTRKSSEEGLEQAFNSLDAQREACEAYIKSQAGEGWHLVRTRYDDGGVSGGTMDRPALQQLLADITARKVDTVVVYKVDRLTRSLADFAKIVEVFDAHGVSFVSVTQQFNTTTSMGRLTLNMLLSFAQFEREVTGERIRDKIAASKKKGMWMGGYPPLGYDVVDKKLVVNQQEAETVRHIFRRYLEHGCVRELRRELDDAGYRSKLRKSADGNITGGTPFTRGALYALLQNRLYIGEVVHKDASYPGEHDAIVDEALWQAVQTRLAENRIDRKFRKDAKETSLLAGLIFDERGDRLTPSHANKAGRRYLYYVSECLVQGRGDGEGSSLRLPASEVETVVLSEIRSLLRTPPRLLDAMAILDDDVASQRRLVERGRDRAETLDQADRSTLTAIVKSIVSRVEIQPDRIDVDCSRDALRHWLLGSTQDVAGDLRVGPHVQHHDLLRLSVSARLKRRGVEAKLIVEVDGDRRFTSPDPVLIKAVAKVHSWNRKLVTGEARSIRTLARDIGVTNRYVRKLLPLAFLAPDIIEAILDGRQPRDLSLEVFAHTPIPKRWENQRRRFGFPTV